MGGEGIEVQDMTKYGASTIRKYTSSSNDDGYIFVMIQNDDKEAVYEETCVYDKF